MIPYTLSTEHLNLTQPLLTLGDWVGAGLILGLRWDPDTHEWSYLLEAPEIEGKRWLRESQIDLPNDET
ncbi:MAG: hypothetical protein OHK0012_28690 [Synechococcales cyanobacterium]